MDEAQRYAAGATSKDAERANGAQIFALAIVVAGVRATRLPAPAPDSCPLSRANRAPLRGLPVLAGATLASRGPNFPSTSFGGAPSGAEGHLAGTPPERYAPTRSGPSRDARAGHRRRVRAPTSDAKGSAPERSGAGRECRGRRRTGARLRDARPTTAHGCPRRGSSSRAPCSRARTCTRALPGPDDGVGRNAREVAASAGSAAARLPNGDPAAVFDRALTVLLDQLERTKFAARKEARAAGAAHRGVLDTASNCDGAQAEPHRGGPCQSRHIPAAVRREVWKRDGGQCAFIGNAGRCSERGLLEFHHVVPFAEGGVATVSNIELRCRSHNAFEAGVSGGQLSATRQRSARLGAAGA